MNRQPEQRIRIKSSGGVTLDGLLSHREGGLSSSPVIVCHPHPAYGGSMHNNVVAAVVSELIERGVTTLRFNYRSTGGPSATEGCLGEVEDLLAVIAELKERVVGSEEVALVGYSFGAYVALKAAEQCAGVKAVFCIAPPVSFMGMAGAGRFEKPKYFIHGLRDGYGLPDDFNAWYGGLPQPKEASALDTDHFYAGIEPLVATLIADRLLL